MNLKFLKIKKKFRKGELGVKPNFYWRYILLGAFVLIISACVFGLSIFLEVNKGIIPSAVTGVEQGIIKKERIEEVLNYFKERETKSTEILNSPSPIVDPSL